MQNPFKSLQLDTFTLCCGSCHLHCTMMHPLERNYLLYQSHVITKSTTSKTVIILTLFTSTEGWCVGYCYSAMCVMGCELVMWVCIASHNDYFIRQIVIKCQRRHLDVNRFHSQSSSPLVLWAVAFMQIFVCHCILLINVLVLNRYKPLLYMRDHPLYEECFLK